MTLVEELLAAGVELRVHTHPPIRTAADLHLTGLDVGTSVKTLAFDLPDGRLALVGLPGRARVRYAAIAQALGVARSALRPAGTDSLAGVGMEPGGVSPLCPHDGVVVLLDQTVPGMGTVFCGGGDPTTSVEVAVAEILRIAVSPVVAAIAEAAADA